MKVYIVINDWCWATSSGFDVVEVFQKEQDALDFMHTSHLDFIHECDKGSYEDFTDYEVEISEEASAITVTSKLDDNLFDRYYLRIKELL
jgi:hypothetical protein